MLDSEDDKNKPSLEELLRVKRAEQPVDDFWRGFDRELEKRLVRAVVQRRSVARAIFDWAQLQGKMIAALSCLSVGAFFLFSGDSAPDSQQHVVPDTRTNPAPAASEALEKVDAWSSSTAPSVAGANQAFVIEVLSSGAGPSAGAGRTWLGTSSGESSTAYYVADQLSSSEQGWSGERLPF